ncbi:MAG: peptidoglycan DD-metalloendopeptidase family protein [Gammaproteobacteria bacterium]|nr:peptidoglycan DD-metalloendopeptidase family protein [Gammaproteobacteria bacterium]
MNLKNPSSDGLWIDYKPVTQSADSTRIRRSPITSLYARLRKTERTRTVLKNSDPSIVRSSLLRRNRSADIKGAVRINTARPASKRPLGKLIVLTGLLTCGAGILAKTGGLVEGTPTSSFKSALLTSASLTPSIPTFRFDDADSILSNSMQTAVKSSSIGRPTSQAFAPQAFASLMPEPQHHSEAAPNSDMSTTAVLLPPLAPRLAAQGLKPVSPESLKQNYSRVVVVESGDSLYRILDQQELPAAERNAILQNDIVTEHLTNLGIGDKIEFDYHWNGELDNISVKVDRDTRITIDRDSLGSYQVATVHLPVEYERVVTSGTIDESLYLAAEKANLKQSTIMELADIFEWELDFARDIRKGDSFSIVYDRLYRDSKYIGDGEILAAEFIRGDRHHRAIRFTDDTGRTDYFSPDGQSKRRSFMRHPVDVVRITSRFDPNRMHPVLHKIRAHKGVDYGAPHGSPIKATADGTVQFSGDKNAYGNTVILQHGDNRSTLYAHMSRIAKKSIKGRKVKRGDIIGYVGKTGRVTGTHLHYEFRINGKHVDPLKVELPVAAALDKQYLPELKALSQELIAQMRSVVPDRQVALAE